MRERVDAVQRMQDYIESHLHEPITLRQLAGAAGYSPWHATRLFKELVGIQPSEYLRARRLSRAALRLRDSVDRVLDVALDTAFQSHEGFIRAFSGRFGLTPEKYRKDAPPVPLFMPRSARDSYLHMTEGAIEMAGKTDGEFFYVQAMTRPARKLILKRGRNADDYWGYCEEVGCDVEGVLSSLKGALYELIGLLLPDSLRKPGTSSYALGVEMPADYAGPIPAGMDVIDLPAQEYLVFQGRPYQDDEMGQSCAAIARAVEAYQPEVYGWRWADEDAPWFQLAPIPERGCIEARPVRPVKS